MDCGRQNVSLQTGFTQFINEPITFGDFLFPRLPGLIYWADGLPGHRCLMIEGENSSLCISFEEGMSCMDLRDERDKPGRPYIHSEYLCGEKFIHQLRTDPQDRPQRGNYAFFHMKIPDNNGKIHLLPGQMTAPCGYEWSNGVEPVLLDILNGIAVCKVNGGVTS